MSRKSARCEKGALRKLRPLALRLNGKFQPRQARIAHLGAQAQDVWRAQGFDAPEVERFAFDQMVRVSTSTAKARAPDEAIEQTARFCGMQWQAPMVVHGAHRVGDAALQAEAQRYRERVLMLCQT